MEPDSWSCKNTFREGCFKTSVAPATATALMPGACLLLQQRGRRTSPGGSTLPRLQLLRRRTVASADRDCLIAPLFQAICLTWTHSKHYGFVGRMVFLLQKFCNLLIDRASSFVREHTLFFPVFSASLRTRHPFEKNSNTIYWGIILYLVYSLSNDFIIIISL